MKKTLYEIYSIDLYKINTRLELVEFVSVSLLGFFLPLFLGHPQILVGTIVNTLIFYSAIAFKEKRILPIIFLPSVAAFLNGLLFGQFTYFLIIFIPFIWMANSIQVFSLRYFLLKKYKTSVSMLLAIIAKASFLFAATFAIVLLTNMPRVFLLAMGPVQLLTAALGGCIVFASLQIKNN